MLKSQSHQLLALDNRNRVLTCLSSQALLMTSSKHVSAAPHLIIYVMHRVTLSCGPRGDPGQEVSLS